MAGRAGLAAGTAAAPTQVVAARIGKPAVGSPGGAASNGFTPGRHPRPRAGVNDTDAYLCQRAGIRMVGMGAGVGRGPGIGAGTGAGAGPGAGIGTGTGAKIGASTGAGAGPRKAGGRTPISMNSPRRSPDQLTSIISGPEGIPTSSGTYGPRPTSGGTCAAAQEVPSSRASPTARMQSNTRLTKRKRHPRRAVPTSVIIAPGRASVKAGRARLAPFSCACKRVPCRWVRRTNRPWRSLTVASTGELTSVHADRTPPRRLHVQLPATPGHLRPQLLNPT